MKKNQVKIKGRDSAHRPSSKVHHLEEITVITSNDGLSDEYWDGNKINFNYDFEIIYEDENIVAINKPPYMATHPTGKHLFYCATVLLEEKYGTTIHSLHRIDRETSGILLFGKNSQIAHDITPLFENRKVKKCYFFIAKKKDSEIKLESVFSNEKRLGPKKDFVPPMFTHCFDQNAKEGKQSHTEFQILHAEKDYVLGLAYPKTGRQHQIRAHAADSGIPLLGDKLYNGDPTIFQRFKDCVATKSDHEMMHIPRHALHAIGLSMPYKNSDLHLISNLPIDLASWINDNFAEINSDKIIDLIKEKIKYY